jgi:hypothetical protein
MQQYMPIFIAVWANNISLYEVEHFVHSSIDGNLGGCDFFSQKFPQKVLSVFIDWKGQYSNNTNAPKIDLWI